VSGSGAAVMRRPIFDKWIRLMFSETWIRVVWYISTVFYLRVNQKDGESRCIQYVGLYVPYYTAIYPACNLHNQSREGLRSHIYSSSGPPFESQPRYWLSHGISSFAQKGLCCRPFGVISELMLVTRPTYKINEHYIRIIRSKYWRCSFIPLVLPIVEGSTAVL
jgi:hypothetical protein